MNVETWQSTLNQKITGVRETKSVLRSSAKVRGGTIFTPSKLFPFGKGCKTDVNSQRVVLFVDLRKCFGGGWGGEWHAGVPEMTSPAFPLPLFLLFSPQNQRCALRIAGGCSKPPMCWWSVAVSGVTPIFWVIFFLFSFFSLVFPVFLANLAGEERSAVAGRCWEDENKGNFYW